MKPINKGGRPSVYEPAFKIAVARDYLSSSVGYGSLAVKYDLPGADTVRGFVKWYKAKYPEVPNSEPIVPKKQNPQQADLAEELKEAQLKIAALETMIEIARKEFGIDIVKKPGTKQSSK